MTSRSSVPSSARRIASASNSLTSASISTSASAAGPISSLVASEAEPSGARSPARSGHRRHQEVHQRRAGGMVEQQRGRLRLAQRGADRVAQLDGHQRVQPELVERLPRRDHGGARQAEHLAGLVVHELGDGRAPHARHDLGPARQQAGVGNRHRFGPHLAQDGPVQRWRPGRSSTPARSRQRCATPRRRRPRPSAGERAPIPRRLIRARSMSPRRSVMPMRSQTPHPIDVAGRPPPLRQLAKASRKALAAT